MSVADLNAVRLVKIVNARLSELEPPPCEDLTFLQALWRLTGDVQIQVEKHPEFKDVYIITLVSPQAGPTLAMNCHKDQDPSYLADLYLALAKEACGFFKRQSIAVAPTPAS